MDKNQRVIDLGPTSDTASFDDAFFAAKSLIDDAPFEIDAVTFTVDGTQVRVTSESIVSDTFERFTVDRTDAS